ncbi:unnamed protein product, partial [Darwinula stevensoni]
YNPLLEIPSEVIKGLKNLEKFLCSGCNLGFTLSSGLLVFRSKSLKLVSLWKNGIGRMDPGAIAGLKPDTTVDLTWNNVSLVSEGIFRPMLEVMSHGDGKLVLENNPIQCDCSLAWLAFAPELLGKVKGACDCANGTDIIDLDLMDSLKKCSRCPHQCLGTQYESLCVPGTVNFSTVGDCRSKELCCRLEIPKAAKTIPAMASAKLQSHFAGSGVSPHPLLPPPVGQEPVQAANRHPPGMPREPRLLPRQDRLKPPPSAPKASAFRAWNPPRRFSRRNAFLVWEENPKIEKTPIDAR